MPLAIPTVDELVMDRRVVWNANNLKEVDEAKGLIMAYKRKGYEIVRVSGEVMERFRPYYEEVIIRTKKVGGHVMKILSEKGDERIVWDKEDGYQAKGAKKKFEELVNKGYKAYSVDTNGKKNRRINEFDIDAEEILMVPKTVKG
jgi:hypothetical protein